MSEERVWSMEREGGDDVMIISKVKLSSLF